MKQQEYKIFKEPVFSMELDGLEGIIYLIKVLILKY